MAQAEFSRVQEVDTSNDSVVIVNNYETIPGGKTLDCSNFSDTVLYAGHPIILDENGEYMPISTDASIAANQADKAVGILIATILKSKPLAGIMVRGTVNSEAVKYPIPNEVKTKLSLIRFTKD